MIISVSAEESFDKIPHPLMIKIKIKTISHTGNRGELPQQDEEHLKKPTATVRLNGEKQSFLTKDESKSRTPPLTTPCQHQTRSPN